MFFVVVIVALLKPWGFGQLKDGSQKQSKFLKFEQLHFENSTTPKGKDLSESGQGDLHKWRPLLP